MDDAVTILMATLNGAEHLPEQLGSIAAQRDVNWKLRVSDDGSRDDTLAVLRNTADRFEDGKVTVTPGPQKGSARNFLDLIKTCDPAPGLVALADQDDVWKPDKLSRACRLLGTSDDLRPAVYASRTWEFGSARPRRRSRRHKRGPDFANALVQNILPGNTIVMNASAARLLQTASTEGCDIPFHDWWIYALVSGVGGRIIHDDWPSLYYRQHNGNLIGAPSGFRARIRRLDGVLRTGDYRQWVRQNLHMLHRNRLLLTEENRDVMDAFSRSLDAPFVDRAPMFLRSGVFRQSRLDGLCVFGATVLGRV